MTFVLTQHRQSLLAPLSNAPPPSLTIASTLLNATTQTHCNHSPLSLCLSLRTGKSWNQMHWTYEKSRGKKERKTKLWWVLCDEFAIRWRIVTFTHSFYLLYNFNNFCRLIFFNLFNPGKKLREWKVKMDVWIALPNELHLNKWYKWWYN